MLTVFAPGRINLIGEHTDYNQGYCIPLTLGLGITVSAHFIEEQQIELSSDYERTDEPCFHRFLYSENWGKQNHWTDYCIGVIAELRKYISISVGISLHFSSTLPAGSGLSSSAALEICTARAVVQLLGQNLTSIEIAKLCQKAENEFVGVNCGILDQLAIADGMSGYCTFIDTQNLSTQKTLFDIPKGFLTIINSQITRELTNSAYNIRRKECEQAVAAIQKYGFQIQSLRDANEKMISCIKEPVLYARAKHVVSENSRVLSAWAAIQQKDWNQLGKIWVESHLSLQNDYEVSCEALDFWVNTVLKLPGSLGARMTGAGFGGCIIALIDPKILNSNWNLIAAEYYEKFGIEPTRITTNA